MIQLIDKEKFRLEFLTERDGIEGAVEFAKRTAKIYRTCVTKRIGMCGDRHHRRRFATSVLEFKWFARINGV